jgi:dTDP-4-amino-4,6-dideoxygalactose transaminase
MTATAPLEEAPAYGSIMPAIPFNMPYTTGEELDGIQQAIGRLHLSGDGHFTRLCQDLLARRFGSASALLTVSCTAALEMSMLLFDIGPGDEVILPSFTFVSTANAVALRGGVPVFVDIDPDTLNLDPALVAAAVTPRTRAIIPVHYASVGCDMAAIMDIAGRHKLGVVEDAAHCFGGRYRGKPLGSFGALATLSFHETKNISSGEGGALLINDPALVERAEILWQKGTNRNAFKEGKVDKYSWVDLGSSFLPSEIIAAFLHAQIRAADRINTERMRVWQAYHDRLAPLELAGQLRRPVVPPDREHNAHLYHVIIERTIDRAEVLAAMRAAGIDAVFHYVPLHDTGAGHRFGRTGSAMTITDDLSRRLIRLPLWCGLSDAKIDHVVAVLDRVLR